MRFCVKSPNNSYFGSNARYPGWAGENPSRPPLSLPSKSQISTHASRHYYHQLSWARSCHWLWLLAAKQPKLETFHQVHVRILKLSSLSGTLGAQNSPCTHRRWLPPDLNLTRLGQPGSSLSSLWRTKETTHAGSRGECILLKGPMCLLVGIKHVLCVVSAVLCDHRTEA